MNALTSLNTANTLTMSSLEIAELLGCRHDNVKVTIERLVAKGVIVRPAMQDEPTKDAMGRTRMMSVYRIGKRDSYVIVAQLSPEFTAKLVDRWQELEAQVTQPVFQIPQTYAEALRLAATTMEEKETLRLQNEAMKPAATIGTAVGSRKRTTIMDFARKLPYVNTMQVQATLAAKGHLHKRQGIWAVYAKSKKFFVEGFDGRGFSVITLTDKGMELVA
ncbi:Phage regulatory protein Rha (Phage_pRha) [Atopomonas hussainii]|uniref:Phage regulatory protein Rha (Phage_pRha) n=1 Tax=Atopomonas hussainii TaxID=1429083 RepID=A0A1H7SR97_9GAMM|nr:Rha family transcriptional regulator [Atopomonas hussainii]SEL74384.1 Phage regulatory protein Rha (Phage_pRha) [Atopomonas hussainii]